MWLTTSPARSSNTYPLVTLGQRVKRAIQQQQQQPGSSRKGITTNRPSPALGHRVATLAGGACDHDGGRRGRDEHL